MERLIPVILFLASGPLILKSQNQPYILKETYPITGYSIIELTTHDAEVKITGSEREDVMLDVYHKTTSSGFFKMPEEPFALEIEQSEDYLIIRERKRVESFSIMVSEKEEYKIDMEVPKHAQLKLYGDDEDYRIEKISGSILINIDDGNILIEECDGDDFDFTIDDGDIKMDRGRGKLFLKCDDSNLYVRNGNFELINLEAEDGNIIIETALSDLGKYRFQLDDAYLELTVSSGGGEFEVISEDKVTATMNFTSVDQRDNYYKYVKKGGNASVKIMGDDSRIKLIDH